MAAEIPDRAMHERSRRDVADEADEVALRRIEGPKDRRVMLAVRPVAVIADGLEREHGDDVVAPSARRPGIVAAAHVVLEEERRLLVREGDEAYGAVRMRLPKEPRELEDGGGAAGVV